MGVVESFGDAERPFCATQLVNEWFDELNCVAAVKVDF